MSHPDGPRTGRPPTYARRGMVTSPHYLATGAGVDALRRGGSAVDAAIATSAMLCVAYPHMAGLGGDGFWLIHDPGERRVRALDASGPAARLATRDFYRERGWRERIPRRGAPAALTVPGVVDGWREAHERYGALPWADLFRDAIEYARRGVPVSRSLALWTGRDRILFREHPEAARTFLRDGAPRREGERLVLTELARSLERLSAQGARGGFYQGETAEEISRALEPAGSPLRMRDFAEYRAEWTEPVSTTYRGYVVHEFPPSTQGLAALQILNLVEGFDVAGWGDGTLAYYHHLAEATKVAFADRDEWLTDPRFVDIPLERLLSKEYADERRRLIDPGRALPVGGVEPGIRFPGAARRRPAGGDTCAMCAVDPGGMAVSHIQSVYYDFGSMAMGGRTGILLQNRGSFFSLDEDHPNRLEPGKRTFHTLTPAMLFRAGEPYVAFGAMGGEGQPQTHAALVTRLVDFGYDVQQAIEAPRWLAGHTWGEESRKLNLEGRIAPEVVRHLERLGQPVEHLADWDDNLGHAQAIRINPDGGFLEGGADPRGDGAAAGF